MSELSVADVLERAADLIEPEGKWTQSAYARNSRGEEVFTRRAKCFCALGAINVAAGNKPHDDAREVQRVLEALMPDDAYEDVPWWNDAPERTQAEVVAKLREAAALARASVDTHPEGGDAQQAPLVSGAVGASRDAQPSPSFSDQPHE